MCTISCDLYTLSDQFAVSNNKAKLSYPVSLATYEELYTLTNNSDSTYYSILTNSGVNWWDLSPFYLTGGSAFVHGVSSFGNVHDSYDVSYNVGVRLVVSLSTGAVITEGDGSTTSPWVIDD